MDNTTVNSCGTSFNINSNTRNRNNKAEKSYFRYNRYSQTSRKENERLLEVVVFFPITTINITFKANKCLINYERNYHYTTGLIAKATSFWTVARVWPMSSNKISVPRTSPVHLHRYLECGERGGYWTLTSRKNTTIDLCIAGRKRLAESGVVASEDLAGSPRQRDSILPPLLTVIRLEGQGIVMHIFLFLLQIFSARVHPITGKHVRAAFWNFLERGFPLIT